MTHTLSPDEFLKLAHRYPVFDVRSPGEYEQAHIPGAISMPLFTNDERADVGTIYKRQGKDAAVEKGLEYVGYKMADMVRTAKKHAVDKKVLVHCWRGGMRSASVAWLLSTAGLQVYILKGGYKGYRQFCRENICTRNPLLVIGGKTGSGKTAILHDLAQHGQHVLDLEGIAHHKGSAFGALGQAAQPTNEMFENLLYHQLFQFEPGQPVWLEDESRTIGSLYIPEGFWNRMRTAPLIFIELAFQERVLRLDREYSHFPPEALRIGVEKIRKRLGFDQAQFALQHIHNGEFREAIAIVLQYYDKAYLHGLNRRDKVELHTLMFEHFDLPHIRQQLLQLKAQLHQ